MVIFEVVRVLTCDVSLNAGSNDLDSKNSNSGAIIWKNLLVTVDQTMVIL